MVATSSRTFPTYFRHFTSYEKLEHQQSNSFKIIIQCLAYSLLYVFTVIMRPGVGLDPHMHAIIMLFLFSTKLYGDLLMFKQLVFIYHCTYFTRSFIEPHVELYACFAVTLLCEPSWTLYKSDILNVR